MFGKRRKLLRNGAQAEAVAIDVRIHGGVSGAAGMSPVWYAVRLRVHYPDGTTSEVSDRLGSDLHGAPASVGVGDIVPVRYDPEQPATVLIDEPALLARAAEQTRALHEAAVERAERKLRGLPDVDTTTPPPSDEQMQKAYLAWRSAAARTEESKAAHKRAEADGTATKGEVLRLFNQAVTRVAEEKSARAKYNDLRNRRPEWEPTLPASTTELGTGS